jgi:uncharacterized protein YegL
MVCVRTSSVLAVASGWLFLAARLSGSVSAATADLLGQLIPLTGVEVSGAFYDTLGKVIITQRWENPANSTTITGAYKFSLDANAVVSGLKMRIGENTWVGQVKEKFTAQAQYKAAVHEGIKSSLLEQLSDNDYQVNVGPIAPGESVDLVIQYLCRALVRPDGTYHFVLPTNIAQKYIGAPGNNRADNEYGDRMSSTPYVDRPKYRFDVDITWTAGSALQEITSPTGPVEVEVLTPRSSRVRCTTAAEKGDFSLLVKTDSLTGAYSYTNADSGITTLYLHNQIPAESLARTNSAVRKITVVLDRSGSMQGNKMTSAIEAVTNFIALLPADGSMLINVVSFGDRYQAMFSHAVVATPERIAKMITSVKLFKADFGGTELLPCLTGVLQDNINAWIERVAPAEGEELAEHVIVLLTDGQVSNLRAIIQMIDSHQRSHVQQQARIMTIGIGDDADRKLVQQVADKSNGICKVLVDENDLSKALSDIIGFIDKHYYTDLKVAGGYEVIQGSAVLYPSYPVNVFLRLNADEFEAIMEEGLSISAWDPARQSTKLWHIPVSRVVPSLNLLEQLYANEVLTELCRKIDGISYSSSENTLDFPSWERLKKEIVDLSVAHGIMNAHTSFIIVSEELIPVNLAPLAHVEVPQHQGISTSITHASALGANPTAGPTAGHTSGSTPVVSASPPPTPPKDSTAFPRKAEPEAHTTGSRASFAGATHFKLQDGHAPAVPSAISTGTPTAAQTAIPTGTPSAYPASTPTAVPAAYPTAAPTASPTAGPTVYPTAFPTASPGANPAAHPTADPTATPAAGPTVYPAAFPTSGTSASPTANPTVSPTAYPTASRSAGPTGNPMVTPNADITAASVGDPAATPTANPAASACVVRPQSTLLTTSPGVGDLILSVGVGNSVDDGEALPPEATADVVAIDGSSGMVRLFGTMGRNPRENTANSTEAERWLEPKLECIRNFLNGTCVSSFAYFSRLTEERSLVIENGKENFFMPPPADRGQLVMFSPGLERYAFTVTHDCSEILVWTLNGQNVVASTNATPSCD